MVIKLKCMHRTVGQWASNAQIKIMNSGKYSSGIGLEAPSCKVKLSVGRYKTSQDLSFINSPNEIEHLGPLSLSLLHALLHGDDDGVGLVISAVLGALLRGP